ncbi:MAG: HAD family hydrolase [Sinobacterium sp.]|nr:HAD family hydrolase [Sinobacterium sp.]
MRPAKPCLFLDRDGIINKDVGYAYKPEQIQFMPGIFAICRHFQQRGFLIVIVTNQSGIARGYYNDMQFQSLNTWLTSEFSRRGISLASIKHCPHHPSISGACDCRKPAPGMLLEAAHELAIDLSCSIMIGDKISDMQAGTAAGVGFNIWISPDHLPYRRKATYNCAHYTSLPKLLAKLA